MNQITERVDRERQLGHASTFADRLRPLLPAGAEPLAAFRIGIADHPARRTPRRPVSAVVRTVTAPRSRREWWYRVLLVALGCCELVMIVRAQPLVTFFGVVAGVGLLAAAASIPGPGRWRSLSWGRCRSRCWRGRRSSP